MQFPNSISMGPTHIFSELRGIHNITAAQISTTSASIL
jgi:hypothetical protein